MKVNNVKEMALFEHGFWLQILGDHSRFILNALSPKETRNIEQANEFINLFDTLLQRSRKPLSLDELSDLNCEAYDAAMELREFKLNILTKQISGKISIDLPPTFVNHMLNELDNYILILDALMVGKIPVETDIMLHLLWLLDGVGHARAIEARLDDTEKELIKRSNMYEKIFTNLYLKAREFKGYTRTDLLDFPALGKLNEDVDGKMTWFMKFLEELEEGVMEKEVLGTLSPLAPDHMYREECYYLTKLSMVASTEEPDCDPGKPRVKE